MSYCAINNNNDDDYTCFSLEELQTIALAFNIYIQKNKMCKIKNDNKICIPKKLINNKSIDKKELWNEIHKTLSTICDKEYCWLDLNFIDDISDRYLVDKIKYFTFKPKMTKKRYDWLNTQDINDILNQYQKIDDEFKFLGAVPSDIDKVTKVHFNEVKDYKKIGTVFNLDKHNQKGSHWVALYIDNINKTIEYFDSAGRPPNKNIATFIKKVQKYIPEYILKINKKEHQKKNSECGIYACYYIIQRLLGRDFEDITEKIVSDQKMNKFRDVLFRPYT